MNHSANAPTHALRRRLMIALTALALVIPLASIPANAHAAMSAGRVASFSASPATVVKGKTITVAAQAQRYSGKAWGKTGALTAAVYFDADGATPNKAVRTFKSNSTGNLKTTFAASASGKWSIRWAKQGSVAAASSVQKYVKVVPAPKATSAKPASKWNCPAWAPIKGNAPSKIYHLKGQRLYLKTTPEICFSTEAAAKAAGYRKSKV
ncbi:sunset domain-containing protein [Arthrobacter sp. TMN-49]